MKVAIVYWSGTGNTEMMAEAVAEGARGAGADIELLHVSDATLKVLESEAVILGCPAMGAEELEDSEFDPFFSLIESSLGGKRIGLFGSYDWGDGEWMRSWQARTENAGARMIDDGLIAHNTPDDAALEQCRELGKKAAQL